MSKNQNFKSATFVLASAFIFVWTLFALTPAPEAQEFSGRGVDMRALNTQSSQCRTPALQLQQRSYVLRQSIADILQCNASGGFFQSDGECVPAVSPPHQFDERAGINTDPEGRARLSFAEGGVFNIFGLIGGLDGEDVICQPEDTPPPGCVEQRETREVDCPPDEFGTILEERFFICPDEVWTPWTEVSNTCSDACVEQSETRDIDCPDGQSGSVTEERQFICPDEVWTPWTEINNICSDVCEEDMETRQGSCPPDSVGWIEESRDFICPDEVWTPWTPVPGGDFCCEDERTLACPAGESGNGIVQNRNTCDDNAWYTVSEDCCESERTLVCPNGQIGNGIVQNRNTCDDNAWYTVSEDCSPACSAYGETWRMATVEQFRNTSQGNPDWRVGQICNPTQPDLGGDLFCCEPGMVVCAQPPFSNYNVVQEECR